MTAKPSKILPRPYGSQPVRSKPAPNLRPMANGRPCMVRLPGCDGGDTTILAHYSLAGVSGARFKSPDECGAWCCHPCHDAVDGRRKIEGYSKLALRLALAEGVVRTLGALSREGYAMRKGQ